MINSPPSSSGLRRAFRVRHTEEAIKPAFTREEILASRLRLSKVLPYQRSSPAFPSNLALAICSGLLLVFAFPDWGLWSLAWVGAAPLIMAVARDQRFFTSLALGTVTGTVFYIGTSHWIGYSIHNYGAVSIPLTELIILLFGILLGLFTGLFAACLAICIKNFGGGAIIAAPLLWVGSEWSRLAVTGIGWNSIGYSQAFQPLLIQIARAGGVYIVSALVVYASAALVFALVYLERTRGIVVLTSAGLLALTTLIYGRAAIRREPAKGMVRVAAVQPNFPIQAEWDNPAFVDEMTDRQISLSERAIKSAAEESKGQRGVDLVIWPESPIDYTYDRDNALKSKLAEFVKRNNVSLLMSTWWPAPNEGLFNSALLIGASGAPINRYDKIALMPFGEYVPARNFIPFADRIPALVADTAAGSNSTLFEVAGARLGLNICFETTRPNLARRLRLEGASALVQSSNEAWFGPTAIARQMLAHSVFRAVENNAELIRVTNSGDSARIDRYGRVSDVCPSFQAVARVWNVQGAGDPTDSGPTFYTTHGDLFAVSCTALGLLFVFASLIKDRVKRNKQLDD
ncbi:MAG: apolipoprotein N-acyltransferase [Blastocatellia bacterium AA13]|nr:MAG: apolipoprotein N-acyltransferase [Blastocatellia bacterium AA13]